MNQSEDSRPIRSHEFRSLHDSQCCPEEGFVLAEHGATKRRDVTRIGRESVGKHTGRFRHHLWPERLNFDRRHWATGQARAL